MADNMVIIGAGMAGARACINLRANGYRRSDHADR